MTAKSTERVLAAEFDARQWILDSVKNYKRKSGIKHLPGFPVTHFGMDELPLVREMIADGTLTEIAVEKPSLTPGRTMTYLYVRVA